MTLIWRRLKAARWLAVGDAGDYHVQGTLPPGQLTLHYGLIYVSHSPADKPKPLGTRSTLANAQLLADIHLRGDYEEGADNGRHSPVSS